jgi:Zn ribbon nucleic-acid-binding protein
MTAPKMKSCPDCGNTALACWGYEWGWKHVECDKCNYIGPGEGSVTKAIRAHNAAIAMEAATAGETRSGSTRSAKARAGTASPNINPEDHPQGGNHG